MVGCVLLADYGPQLLYKNINIEMLSAMHIDAHHPDLLQASRSIYAAHTGYRRLTVTERETTGASRKHWKNERND